MTDPEEDDPQDETIHAAGSRGRIPAADNNRSQHADAASPKDAGKGLKPEEVVNEDPPRPVRPLPFVRPTEEAFIARPPRLRGLSPHTKNPAYELPIEGPNDLLVKVTFQPTDGNLDRPVIDGKLAVANIPQTFIDTLNANPDEFALIVPFLGGAAFFKAWGSDKLVAAITTIFVDSGLASADDFEIIYIPADKAVGGKDLYAPPFVIALRTDVLGVIDRLCAIATFIATRDLAFHVIHYNPEVRTWTLALYKASSREGDESNGRYLRWCLACLILDNAEVRRAYQRATGTSDTRPILTRLLEWACTVHVRWNGHSKHWVAFAMPCAADYEPWEAVRVAIRGKDLRHPASLRTYTAVATSPTQAPWCLRCRNDDHLHFGCPPRFDDPESYWGPLEQLSRTTEGILAKAAKPSGGGGASSNGGGGGNSQNGGRGGGGGGQSRPRNQNQRQHG
ncbi:hypothetical protein C8R46DRAFT_1099358 [Mycena filopes]|nr:hypothetical protein C8R46DRAFT_1099358 [Mycena filopes]